jgi:hypothetical protein
MWRRSCPIMGLPERFDCTVRQFVFDSLGIDIDSVGLDIMIPTSVVSVQSFRLRHFWTPKRTIQLASCFKDLLESESATNLKYGGQITSYRPCVSPRCATRGRTGEPPQASPAFTLSLQSDGFSPKAGSSIRLENSEPAVVGSFGLVKRFMPICKRSQNSEPAVGCSLRVPFPLSPPDFPCFVAVHSSVFSAAGRFIPGFCE